MYRSLTNCFVLFFSILLLLAWLALGRRSLVKYTRIRSARCVKTNNAGMINESTYPSWISGDT